MKNVSFDPYACSTESLRDTEKVSSEIILCTSRCVFVDNRRTRSMFKGLVFHGSLFSATLKKRCVSKQFIVKERRDEVISTMVVL